MSKITMVGIDLAKNVFSVHGVDESGTVMLLALKARCGYHKAVVAVAAKNARIIWALLARGTTLVRPLPQREQKTT